MMPTAIKPRPGRPRSVEAHRAILGAAADLVCETGYDRASMEAIAARAGVGKQTIYRRWPSKHALLLDFYSAHMPAGALTSNAQRAEIRLANLLIHLFDGFGKAPIADILAGLIAAGRADPVLGDKLTGALTGPLRALFMEIFADGAAAREVPEQFNAEAACDDLLGFIWFAVMSAPERFSRDRACALARHICSR